MSENQEFLISDDVKGFLIDLLEKGRVTNEKTQSHSNVSLCVGDVVCPIRVDDVHLLVLGCLLLPNILNYIVNIIPQFLYPYVVAYLQDLSNYRDDPFTLNELYNIIVDLKNGNILDGSKTEN